MTMEDSPSEEQAVPVGGDLSATEQKNGELDIHPMDALLAESEIDLPKRGEIRIGTVARITPNEILVDIGAKTEGIVNAQELDKIDPEVRDSIKMGEDVKVFVVNPHARHGNIILSIAKAEAMRDWELAEKLLESEEVYEGELAGYNKGGMIMRIGHLRGFIPASQMSLARRRQSVGETPAQRWSGMVGDAALVKVLEVDRDRNRLILSERSAAKEYRSRAREQIMAELQVGDKRTGRVNSLADFGAFVDLGGIEGLVHVSELTWKPIDHPKEVLSIGDEVEVQILNVDEKRNRIGLSMKLLEPDPWSRVLDQYQSGQLVEATITRLAKFGAFARLKETPELEGLVRIAELSHDNIDHPKEVVQEGEDRILRIIEIDAGKRRMSLSVREVDSARYANLDYEFYVGREEAEAEEVAPDETEVEEVVSDEATPETTEADEVEIAETASESFVDIPVPDADVAAEVDPASENEDPAAAPEDSDAPLD